MVRVGLLNGSLGESSSNLAALTASAAHLADAGHSAVLISNIRDIAAFEPMLVDTPPDEVQRFRAALSGVDAVIIAAPEYAAGLAGSTKNALDWLVGASTLYRKPVAVISSGTTGGQHAIEQLVYTLSWQGAWVCATLGIDSPRPKMIADSFHDPVTIEAIGTLVEQLLVFARGPADVRRAQLMHVLDPFGIDVARFGDLGDERAS